MKETLKALLKEEWRLFRRPGTDESAFRIVHRIWLCSILLAWTILVLSRPMGFWELFWFTVFTAGYSLFGSATILCVSTAWMAFKDWLRYRKVRNPHSV